MKSTLFSLLLLLSLSGCSSTKSVIKAEPAPAPASGPAVASSGGAFPEAVVLSPAQVAPPARETAGAKVLAVSAPAKTMAAEEPVQQVPFQISVSSVTVEKIAAQKGCKGGKGASLVTEKGPIEVYKMVCDSGKVFLAKCELRQCKSYSGE